MIPSSKTRESQSSNRVSDNQTPRATRDDQELCVSGPETSEDSLEQPLQLEDRQNLGLRTAQHIHVFIANPSGIPSSRAFRSSGLLKCTPWMRW